MKNILRVLPKSLNEHLFLGLDRDGTLVPHASHPEKAILGPKLLSTLQKLALMPQITLAVVSARSVQLLRADFGNAKLVLAGNYGLEIFFPAGTHIVESKAQETVVKLQQVKEILSVLTNPGVHAILEDHGFSLCLHWHTVHKEALDGLHQQVALTQEAFPQLRFRKLPTSYEVLPDIDWDKSKALDILETQLFSKYNRCFYLFAGDSPADEPAFAWVNKRQGVSIKIGNGHSCAQHFLPDPEVFANLLEELQKLRSGFTACS